MLIFFRIISWNKLVQFFLEHSSPGFFRNKFPLNNSRIEMHQSQQTTKIHNAVPQPVDPITWRRLAISSRNIAFYIMWPCRKTTEQTYNIIQLPRWTTTYFITNSHYSLSVWLLLVEFWLNFKSQPSDGIWKWQKMTYHGV